MGHGAGVRNVILDPPVRHWHCPACDGRDRTQGGGAQTRMHACPATRGMTVPMIEVPDYDESARARHFQHLGEDGAVAAISTEHISGRVDCTVFPLPAVARVEMRG